MTVQNVIVKNIYAGNGSNTSWPYTFACPENHPEFIKAYIKDPEGNVHQTEDFKVDTSTKTVTYPVTGKVLSAEEKIVIARELPLYQVLNLVNQGPFFAEDVEVTFDELVMMIQQLNEKLERTMSFSIDVNQKVFDPNVPIAAGKTFRINNEGTGFEVTADPEKVYNDCLAISVNVENDAAAAQNAADVSNENAIYVKEQADKITDVLKKTDGYVTPQMFGAKGDGVTDDTAAFQQLNGKVAYIPSGTYLVSSVTFGAGTQIDGAGMGKTIIKQKSNCFDDMLIFRNAPNSSLKNVTLLGRGYDSGEQAHTYLFQALLKILATSEIGGYSNSWCVFEHLSIKDAPANGMVLLGNVGTVGTDYRFSDERYPQTYWNWVHHFNDIRIEHCKRWCLIDKTSDNRFSNFYLSDGDVGCFLMQGVGSNMYQNFKIDQPYSQGANGTEAGYVDGACLLMRNSSTCCFINLDVQSAFYAGIKMYYCQGMQLQGIINNCGRHSLDGGTCLMIDASNNCQTRFEYHTAGYKQARNISISNTCTNVGCYMIETVPCNNINGNPTNCFIVDEQKRLARAYNAKFNIDDVIDNKVVNPLCESASGWAVSLPIDTNSKVAGTNSFIMQGNGTGMVQATQNITDLKPNAIYACAFVGNVETLDSTSSGTPTPYLVVVNQAGAEFGDTVGKSKLLNQVGKSLAFKIAKTNDVGQLQLRAYCYKNNSKSYIGNFLCFALTDLIPDSKLNTSGYIEIYNQLNAQINTIVSTVSYEVTINDVMGLVKKLYDERANASHNV